MFNSQIVKSAFKGNFAAWLSLTLLGSLILILLFIASPNDLVSILGSGTSGLLSLVFLTNIGFQLILIFIIVAGNKLIASEVEKGYLAYFFSSPLSRTKVIMSKMNFFILSIFGTSFIYLIIGLILKPIVKASIGYDEYTLLILGQFLLLFATGGIAFIFSALFNKSAWSLACTTGLVVIFYICYSLSVPFYTPPETHFLRYFSLNTLYIPDDILFKPIGKWLPELIALFVIGVGLYTGGVFIFNNKDLPL